MVKNVHLKSVFAVAFLGLFFAAFSFGQEIGRVVESSKESAATVEGVKNSFLSGQIVLKGEEAISDEGPVPLTGPLAFPEAVPVANPQNPPYVRPNSRLRRQRYVNSVIGPYALAGDAASAGFATITNNPEEWGKTGEGFARRFASAFATGAIRETTVYGLDQALEYDSFYYRSGNRNLGARIGHAVLSPVTAYNKEGRRVVGVPRIVGTYGAAVIAREAWYPDRYSYRDGLRAGTITLGVTAAVNLVKEFFIY